MFIMQAKLLGLNFKFLRDLTYHLRTNRVPSDVKASLAGHPMCPALLRSTFCSSIDMMALLMPRNIEKCFDNKIKGTH